MNSNKELWDFVANLQHRLEARGEFAAADKLHSAMYISSVLTEVYMAVRHELTQLRDSEIELTTEIRDKINEAIRDIGVALR